jgi:hypothetical protein
METAAVVCSNFHCCREMKKIEIKCTCNTPYCSRLCLERDIQYHECKYKGDTLERTFYKILDDLNRNDAFFFMSSFFAHELNGQICVILRPTHEKYFQSSYEVELLPSNRPIAYQSDEAIKWTVGVIIVGKDDRAIHTGSIKIDKQQANECYMSYKHSTLNRELPMIFDITP